MRVSRINVEFIDHRFQRYDTCGDWWFRPDTSYLDVVALEIRVSKLPDHRSMQAIALHEQVEALLCLEDGINEESVMEFDLAFEDRREPGNMSEPGDSPEAPYHSQHKRATLVEQCFLSGTGLSWEEHEALVDSLPPWGKPSVE